MTCEKRSSPMNCGTRTEPYSQTRPTSLRPRSTSITCSARSFSLRFSSSASRTSSSSVRPRRPRAGNRMRLDPRALDAHQHLRRRADHRDAAHADEIHVRRRVHVPQRAVDGERIGVDLGLEPLRQHHLIDVAGGDVLLRRAHLLLEPLARVVRRDRRAAVAAPAARPTGCARARARGTESWRRRTDTATRGRRRP